MTSIRRHTTLLVASAVAVLLVAGGVLLLNILIYQFTQQFDDTLLARAHAL